MSEIKKACPAPVTSTTYLKAYDECAGTDVKLSLDDLPQWPALATCDVVASCPVIGELKAKDVNLQSQIDSVNSDINGIYTDITNINNDINDLRDADRSINIRIDEVNTNITMLKWWNVRQESKIKSLETKVVRDLTHLDFNEWVQDVYIPGCGLLENKYSQGDIYINANQSVAATNATYINIRPSNSTAPCSAADWQEIYYSSPADVLTIIGIDPIEIQNPYKNEWNISINPIKLEDFLSKLSRINLCDVEVRLGEVYGCGEAGQEVTYFKDSIDVSHNVVIGDSLDVSENVTVGNKATIKDLSTTNTATFNGNTVLNDQISIPGVITSGIEVTGDSVFHADVDIDGTLDVTNLTLKQQWSANFDWSTHFNNQVSLNGPISGSPIVQFISDVEMDSNLKVWSNLTTSNIEVISSGSMNNIHMTGSTQIDRVDGRIELSDEVVVGGPLNVNGATTIDGPLDAHDLHVSDTAYLPDSAGIFLNGQGFEAWLTAFGDRIRQRR